MQTNPAEHYVHSYFKYVFSMKTQSHTNEQIYCLKDKLFIEYHGKTIRLTFKQNRMYTSNGVFFL